ncbi:hypothetical protein K435DRAFT_779587 [Dendrothele bispora CBS 962.96]|uniref:Uncharacterized protein n=1 Tax=Dendrothele bispora (strain CBS 962.96) TaxID=1314807 RepID=A0A4S8LWV0_DENBC|nr:hypothetical protein K435DRAFT_779587 [Dendrothele bispora CBS 962.96]
MLESRDRPLTSITELTAQPSPSTTQSLTESKDENTFPCPLAYFKLIGSHTERPETLTCMPRFQYLAGLPGRNYSFVENFPFLREARARDLLAELSSTSNDE